ncbi:hypothetical protein ACTGNR_19065 (plasmid) [Halococcus salifodinae]
MFVDDEGEIVRCSCKGHKYNGNCVHQDEIETRPLVRTSAVAAATETSQQIATDGGTTQARQTDNDDIQTDTTTDDHRPQTDHWGNEVEHFDDGPVGAGEKSECQSCGARFEIALIAATKDSSNRNWEEFYRCEACGARGSFRFNGRCDTRSWTGRIAYPDER